MKSISQVRWLQQGEGESFAGQPVAWSGASVSCLQGPHAHHPLGSAPPSVPGRHQGGRAGHPGSHLEWSTHSGCLAYSAAPLDWLAICQGKASSS